MKECSIVFLGLKNGLSFIEGKFSEDSISEASNAALNALAAQFKSRLQDDFTDQTIDHLARRLLAKAGWKVVYSDYASSIDESMSESEAKKFIQKLKEGEVLFKYKKVKDKGIRKANGTLKPSILKHELSEFNKARRRRHVPSSIIIYFDLAKKMFRSFRKANFIGYIK